MVPLLFLSAPEVQKRLASPRLFTMLPWVIAVSAVALELELYSDGVLLHLVRGTGSGVLTGYNRGFSYTMMLAWPVGAYLWYSGKPRHTVVFVLALLLPLVLTLSRATQLATMVALAVCIISWWVPVLVTRVLQLVVVLAMGWPMGGQYLLTHAPD